MKSGDIEFCISASANAATLSPQAGVMSLHFLFRSEDHLVKAVADPAVVKAVREMIDDTVQGAHVLAVTPLRLREIYSKREGQKIEGIQGMEGRLPGKPTGNTNFAPHVPQTPRTS